MDLTIGRKRKYKLPIIIIASIAVVFVTITASIIIYAKFFMGTGPVAGCEKKVFESSDRSASQNYYICDKELFSFQVHEDIAYDLPENYLNEFHDWFKNEVTYGPEITTFKSIRLTTWAQEHGGTIEAYAEYIPSQSHISLFFDSNEGTELTQWRKFLGDDSVNRYDLRIWKYTVSHEYGHHATVKNMSDNRLISRINNTDVAINENGKKFFTENGYAAKQEFQGKSIGQVLLKDRFVIDKATNEYLWTYAEMMTRELQTYTNNGLGTQKFKDDLLIDYKGGSLEDTYWRDRYSLLGYNSATKDNIWIPTTLKDDQKNTSAIANYLFGANDNPLHALYYDSSIGYVFNTSSSKFTLTDQSGKDVAPSATKEISNFWYNQTFLDGNTKQELTTERYALTYKSLKAGTYTLNLKGENPTNPAMSLDENKSTTIYNQATNGIELAMVQRGTGNNYTITIY